jgi:putative DNA primase/helicase
VSLHDRALADDTPDPASATTVAPKTGAAATRPTTLPVDPGGIPRELTDLTAWVVWRLEPKPDKPGEWTKIPYRAADPSRKASSTDPATWSTFGEAFSAYQFDPTLSGVGLVLHGDGIVGIDLDNALDESGHAKGWARAIVDKLPGAYWERSPGGRGLRGLCRGQLPPGRRKVTHHDGTVEMYDDGRFLTMTGVAP